MARRTAEITIQNDSRDGGKIFVLTEMPANQAEKWAARALLALTNSGIQIPDEMQGAGMAAIATIAIQAFSGIAFEAAEPLMDEMFGCIQIKEKHLTRRLTDDDIEEVATRLTLRGEDLSLHLGFSLAERVSALKAAKALTT
jgi:hypothetical protein